MAASTHTAVDSQQHSIQTDDVRLTTMQCPVDGTQLSDSHRDDDRVECPACRGRFDVAEVIVDE
jgi:nitrite reductase/ring-hydroxylating ferredoxin subunit